MTSFPKLLTSRDPVQGHSPFIPPSGITAYLSKRALPQGLLPRWRFYHSPRYCPIPGGFKLLMLVTSLEHFFLAGHFFRIQLTRLPSKFQRTLANNSQAQDCKPLRYQLIVAYSYFPVLSVIFKHPTFSMTYPKLMWLLYMNIIASLLGLLLYGSYSCLAFMRCFHFFLSNFM